MGISLSDYSLSSLSWALWREGELKLKQNYTFDGLSVTVTAVTKSAPTVSSNSSLQAVSLGLDTAITIASNDYPISIELDVKARIPFEVLLFCAICWLKLGLIFAQIEINGQLLRGKLDNVTMTGLELDLTLMNSTWGPIDLKWLTAWFVEFGDAVVLPQLNDYLKKGFAIFTLLVPPFSQPLLSLMQYFSYHRRVELPLVQGIELKNTNIKYHDGYLNLDSSFAHAKIAGRV